MKKLLLALMLIFATTHTKPVEASGSTTVLLKVAFKDYKMSLAIRDLAFNSSKLYGYFTDFLESAPSSIYVARVNPAVYSYVNFYNYYGVPVALDFEDYRAIEFEYCPEFKAIVGQLPTGEMIILLPLRNLQP